MQNDYFISDLGEYMGNTVKKTARFLNAHWVYNACSKHHRVVSCLL